MKTWCGRAQRVQRTLASVHWIVRTPELATARRMNFLACRW
jgi:hypothetical protein